MAHSYIKASDLPQVIPVFPLAGAIVLPRGQLPLNIFEPRYLNMIDDAMAGDRCLVMVQTAGGPKSLPKLAPVGGLGRITSFSETSDGRYLITLTGVCRVTLGAELPVTSPYRQCRLQYAAFESDLTAPEDDLAVFDRGRLMNALRSYLHHRQLDIDWETAEAAPPEPLVNSLSMALPFDPSAKQLLLEAPDLVRRTDALIALLQIDAADPGDGEPPPMQ